MKALKVILLVTGIAAAACFAFFYHRFPPRVLKGSLAVGEVTDEIRGVRVYNNGPVYPESHGKHYTPDSSYYFGKKWQCVEFIKRYYFLVLHHKMPDGFGHAKDFFDPAIPQGALNKKRGLLQYHNGGNDRPRPDDILVFGGRYGHVAIVTRVEEEELEVIQQNIFMRPREYFKIVQKDGKYTVGEGKKPLGWLRKKLN